jgi:hypothetical protein
MKIDAQAVIVAGFPTQDIFLNEDPTRKEEAGLTEGQDESSFHLGRCPYTFPLYLSPLTI